MARIPTRRRRDRRFGIGCGVLQPPAAARFHIDPRRAASRERCVLFAAAPTVSTGGSLEALCPSAGRIDMANSRAKQHRRHSDPTTAADDVLLRICDEYWKQTR